MHGLHSGLCFIYRCALSEGMSKIIIIVVPIFALKYLIKNAQAGEKLTMDFLLRHKKLISDLYMWGKVVNHFIKDMLTGVYLSLQKCKLSREMSPSQNLYAHIPTLNCTLVMPKTYTVTFWSNSQSFNTAIQWQILSLPSRPNEPIHNFLQTHPNF